MPEDSLLTEDARAREAAWQRWRQEDEQGRGFRQAYAAFCAGWYSRSVGMAKARARIAELETVAIEALAARRRIADLEAVAARSPSPSHLEEAVGEVWDDGNASGLDGWTGPNRGAGTVDQEAVRHREFAVATLMRLWDGDNNA